jgi:hypothetical protein
MFDDDDLEAAVAERILTAEQVEKLRAFVGGRRLAADRADDERFRFMRGFNDFFFAVGIVLFGAGIAYFAGREPLNNLLAAMLVWALAEYLVRRMRLVLPGILLACLFAFFVFRLTDWASIAHLIGLSPNVQPQHAFTPFELFFGESTRGAVAVRALATALATALFYVRFRLPFALLLIAASLVLFVLALISVFLPLGSATYPLLLLACGLAVFAAAMAYDLADRARTTRQTDCAFWLHLLAAPLIVHSLIRLILPVPEAARVPATPFGLTMTTTSAVTIVVIVACLTAVAVLIDRRALLVSALIYLGVAIGYALAGAVRTGADNQPIIFFATLVILGVLVLALGVGWQPLRRLFLRLFPPGLVNRLPPAAYPA